jgi:hypothetical protein
MLRKFFRKSSPSTRFEAQDWHLVARPLPWLSLVRGDEQTPSTRALFQKVYRQTPPEFPAHYIALIDNGQRSLRVAAYLHMTQFEDVSLLGGLCVATDIYHTLARRRLRALNEHGSLATLLVKSASHDRSDSVAVFGYLGDPTSRNVSAAASFIPTAQQNLYVLWRAAADSLEATQRAAIIDKVFAVTPF